MGLKFISRNEQSTRKDKDAFLSCQNGITIDVNQGAISSGTASQGADQEREYEPTKRIMEASQGDKEARKAASWILPLDVVPKNFTFSLRKKSFTEI